MISLLVELFKILNSETDPPQISLSICFAMVVGLTPLFSLHNLILIFLVCFLRVNISAFILFWPLFSAVAYLLDPFFHTIGWALLTAPSLESLWTVFYNIAFFKLARFNNTIVMGSLIFSLTLFLPVFLLGNYLIRRYRESFMAWIQQTKLVQVLKASKLYSIYRTVSGAGGA